MDDELKVVLVLSLIAFTAADLRPGSSSK